MWADAKLFVILAGMVVIGSIGLDQQSSFSMPMDVDFDLWAEETFPPVPNNLDQANWVVQSDDTMILQTDNGQPTFYYSDFTSSFNKEITISMSVDGSATTDDDFIGFAIGFTPGDATLPADPDADYLILDWKKATQGSVDFGPDGNGGTGLIGMALSRVSGFPSANELYQHTDYPDIAPFVGSVTEIARAINLGSTAWAFDTTYDFEITYTPDRIQVRVNGVLEFDEMGSFPDGRATLYNFSQDNVLYEADSILIIPQAISGSQTVTKNSIDNVLAPALTGSDDDGSPLTDFTISTPPTDGVLDISSASISCDDPAIPVTCTFGPVTYTPDPDFFGSDSFEFTVTDGIDTSLPALFEITFDDGDGIDEDIDNCPIDDNPGQEDTDNDGLGNVCDPFPFDELNDSDGDGIGGDVDNCPSDANTGQEDTDENGIGDACQDVDGDSILDTLDNCPFIPNPEQTDDIPEPEGNGIGDACEETESLLVQATFPPGDTVKVNLPGSTNSGPFSISLKLPNTNGGSVIIDKTDAGETSADFKFLGTIIDFTAPCTNDCEISFTFTQALLDELGLTLDEVTIFHDGSFDGVHNGSFEDNEAIPTEITDNGDGTFTATATASFTSKFSVGGIKALALGALGSGGFKGGNPPTLENLAFDGVRTINSDGTIGFGGLLIDEISRENNFPTQTIETGVPFELRLPFYEDNGVGSIEHVAVYVLHEGDKTLYDSELYLVYDTHKPLESFDSNGYLSDFSLDIIEKSSRELDMIFGMTFALPMEQSDIVVRSWDKYKRSSDYKFNDLIQVVGSDSSNELVESLDLTSSDSQTGDKQNIIADNELESEDNQIDIPLWIKYNANWWSQQEIGDDEFIAGIKYLIESDIILIPEFSQDESVVEEIPSWVRYNAEWWAGDLVSDKEFVGSIQWLIENGVMII